MCVFHNLKPNHELSSPEGTSKVEEQGNKDEAQTSFKLSWSYMKPVFFNQVT